MIVFEDCGEVLCSSVLRAAVFCAAVFCAAVFCAAVLHAEVLRAAVFCAVVPVVRFATAIVHSFVVATTFVSGFILATVSAVVVDDFIATVFLFVLFFVVWILHFGLYLVWLVVFCWKDFVVIFLF